MAEKLRAKSSFLRHSLVLALPVLGLVYASWRLLRDTDILPFDPDGRPLAGQVLHSEGDVKRRPPTRLRWFSTPDRTKIYSRDTVRTTDSAATQVKLPDGAEILLGPNSQAVFIQEGGRARVSLGTGQMQFRAGTGPLVVESQGKAVQITAGTQGSGLAEARSGAGVDPEGSIKILQGKAQILGPSGKTVPLPTDVLMTWGAGSGELIERTAGEMLTPTSDAEIAVAQIGSPAEVSLSWSRADAQVDVARDGDFSQPVFSQRVKGKSVVVPLPIGQYRWRVWLTGAARPLAARGFHVQAQITAPAQNLAAAVPAAVAPAAVAPAAVAPAVPSVKVAPAQAQPPVGAPLPEVVLENTQGTRVSNAFDAKGMSKKLSIRILWKPYPGVRSYRVKFSTQPNLAKPFLERIVERNEYAIARENLPALKVYYQIEAVLGDGRAGKSPITPFVFDFSAPRLVAPVADLELSAESGGAVMMTWEKTNYTDAYRVEVARDSKFKQIVQSKEIKENFTLMRSPTAGDYYWRVRSLAPPVVSDPSLVRHFKVK